MQKTRGSNESILQLRCVIIGEPSMASAKILVGFTSVGMMEKISFHCLYVFFPATNNGWVVYEREVIRRYIEHVRSCAPGLSQRYG